MDDKTFCSIPDKIVQSMVVWMDEWRFCSISDKIVQLVVVCMDNEGTFCSVSDKMEQSFYMFGCPLPIYFTCIVYPDVCG